MKSPAFAYARPASLGEVFTLLQTHGDGAKLLAGGQSLLATLNLRLSAPDILIDITALPGLSGISVGKDTVRIGALTTHREIEHSGDIAKYLPLLAQAVPHVAHVAIRNVGTFGGSIAMADPAFSRGFISSKKVWLRGTMAAPKSPCIRRNSTIDCKFQASPHKSEAATNPTIDTKNSSRLPIWSASQPVTGVIIAAATM